jgi:hypothetical protein
MHATGAGVFPSFALYLIKSAKYICVYIYIYTCIYIYILYMYVQYIYIYIYIYCFEGSCEVYRTPQGRAPRGILARPLTNAGDFVTAFQPQPEFPDTQCCTI